MGYVLNIILLLYRISSQKEQNYSYMYHSSYVQPVYSMYVLGILISHIELVQHEFWVVIYVSEINQ